ncbi:TonB-dependent receptor [Paraglaciecola arctica]|nr:TonB-dependent receptor [Paraglaciecola arctica]
MHTNFSLSKLVKGIALGLVMSSVVQAQQGNIGIDKISIQEAVDTLSKQYGKVIIVRDLGNKSITLKVVSGFDSVLNALNASLAGSGYQATENIQNTIVIEKVVTDELPSNLQGKTLNKEGAGIEKIVVTAHKSDKSMQDLATSISVLSGDNLSRNNINNVFNMSDKIPSFVVSSVQGYRPTISIRGVGNEIPDNAGTKQAVAYHVDGVFMVNDYALLADLQDIERVELTRGPDGTVYGNSSTGGALNVITKRPELSETYGFAEAAMGSYQQRELKAMLNLPLSNTIATRVAVSHRENEGYTENLALDNYRLDDVDNQTFRAQVSWQPDDNLSLLLQHQYFKSDTHGPALKGGFDTKSTDPRVVYHDTAEFYNLSTAVTSLHLDWTLDFAKLNSIFSKQKYDMGRKFDIDRSDLTANDPAPLQMTGVLDLLGEAPIPQFVGNLRQIDHSNTAEINLVSEPNESGIEWVVGAFWLDTQIFSRTSNFVDDGRDGQPLNETIAGPNVFANNADIDFINSDFRNFKSHALFGQLSYPLIEDLNITAGLRYTKNQFEDERCSYNCVPTREPISSNPSESNNNLTGKFGLDYRWSQQNMTYFTLANGIKPAGSNSSVDIRFFPEVFEQETLVAYEIGNKSDLFDKKVRLNVAGFYYDYKDYLFESSGIGRFDSGASNIPKAEVYGIEMESEIIIHDNLTLNVSLSMMDSKIIEGREAIDRAVAENLTVGLIIDGASSDEINAIRESTAQDLTGNKLAKIPKTAANIRLNHFIEMNNGLFETSLGYTFRDEYFSRVFNSSQRDIVPSYHLYNLNLSYTPYSEKWNVAVNVQNLFDKVAIASRHTDTFGLGFTSDQYLSPRIITLKGRYNF